MEERARWRKSENLDIVFSVEEIEKLYETVQHMAVNIIQPLRDLPYGREFYITDPDGHVLGFVAES